MTIFALEGYFSLAVLAVMVTTKGFALVSAARFPAESYPAASRGTKTGWLIGLGLGFVAQLLMMGSQPFNLISLVFLIAALVFITDTRPALDEVTSRY